MDGRKLHIDKNHLLLRGCRIKNTDVVEGLVVYTGLCIFILGTCSIYFVGLSCSLYLLQ